MAGILEGLQYVQQQGELGRQRGMQSRLGRLVGQAYGAPRDQQDAAIQQVVATDPGTGFRLSEAIGKREQIKMEELGKYASIIDSLPEDQKAASYPRIAQEMNSRGIPVPTEWHPEMGKMISRFAQTYGGRTSNPTEGRVVGNRIVDPVTGKVIYDGPETPVNSQLVEVPDGRGGTIQKVFNPRTGEFSTPSYGGGGATSQVLNNAYQNTMGSLDPVSDFPQLASGYGAKVSSLFRDPAKNAQVGGVANSQHTRGTAGDFVVPADKRDAFLRDARAKGYEAIDEKDHIHLELPPGARAGSQFAAGQNLGYSPPKQKEAPSGYRYRDDGRLEFIPGGPSDPSTPKPIDPAKQLKLQQTQKKERALLSSTEAKLDQTIKLVDEILKGRDDFGGVTGIGAFRSKIPGTDWADLAAKMETLRARSAFGSLQEMRANSPTGGALGSVTERELGLLQNAETQLSTQQSPGAMKTALEDYKNTLLDTKRRLRSGVDEYYSDSVGDSGNSSSGPTVGAEVDGYRFKGGDPADQNSWEKI